MATTPWTTILAGHGTLPAFKPFAIFPYRLTYAELGLPDDWDARWEQEEIDGFGHLLAKIAEEAWARTEEPTHDAATAPAEMAVARSAGTRPLYIELESLLTVELFAMAAQAALVGWGLAQTMQYASDLELWLQQAMGLVGLRMMTPDARRAARDACFRAYEADTRQHGEPAHPRRPNWADAPTIAAGNDAPEETSS